MTTKANAWFPVSAGVLTAEHYQRLGPAWLVFFWMIHEERRPQNGEPDKGMVMTGEPISYEDIGARLGLSPRTVEKHVMQLEREKYIRSDYIRGKGKRYFIRRPLRWSVLLRAGDVLPKTGESNGCDSPNLGSSTPQSSVAVLPKSGEVINKETRTTRTARTKSIKTSLPAGFTISDSVRRWAELKGHEHLEQHLENFVGVAKANGYEYVDWDQAFMNAIRGNWAKLGGAKNGNGKPSVTEIVEREQAIVRARAANRAAGS